MNRSSLPVRLAGAHLECLAWASLLEGCFQISPCAYDLPPTGNEILLLLGIPASLQEEPTPEACRSLVLVTRGDPLELAQAARLGIDVLVSPDDSIETLQAALGAAAEGAGFCSPRLVSSVLQLARSAAAGESLKTVEEGLSPREEEVAGLVASGLTNGEVASRLHVEERTIKSHLTRIYQKLAVKGRQDLRTLWPRLPKRYT